MITLVDLGVVERGQIPASQPNGHLFRRNWLGRAIFGGPEIAPRPSSRRIAAWWFSPTLMSWPYMQSMDAPTAATLARIAETGPSTSVQTFRLTQTSVYRAAEEGLDHDQIIAFLKQHSQIELPPNVSRSIADWSVKREAWCYVPKSPCWRSHRPRTEMPISTSTRERHAAISLSSWTLA